MSLVETRIVTVGWDESAQMFDDGVLREYLAERDVIRAEPQFFIHRGRPYWSVFLETRALQGSRAVTDKQAVDGRALKRSGERMAALQELLTELDEVERVRYERILQWRRDTAGREGVPPFVLCDNRQAVELARRAPRTMQALAAIKGFGPKRVKKHGKQILEVLHGRIPESDARQPDPVRAVDGDGEVDAEPDRAVSEAGPAESDEPAGEHDAGDPGGSDDGGVPEGQDEDADGDQ